MGENSALTDELHEARAMLLGMTYYRNFDRSTQIYYKLGGDKIPQWDTVLDANTLELFSFAQQKSPFSWKE